MKQSFKKWFLLVVGTGVVFYACKHEIPTSGTVSPAEPGVVVAPGSSGRTCSSDTVYFANEILPLVNSSCAMAGCHDAVSRAEGLNLTSYQGILKIVSAGRASSSKLYSEIVKTGSSRMPPPPLPALATDKIAKIQKWINQGALNNVCDNCDTTDFKYSTAIKNLLQNKCVGCHSTASPGGGIDLSTYASVKTVAANGRLYGSVTWAPGFSAMPKGAAKMPDCEIKQLKKWIDSGIPNN
jgi:uncharacterized membrane protein